MHRKLIIRCYSWKLNLMEENKCQSHLPRLCEMHWSFYLPPLLCKCIINIVSNNLTFLWQFHFVPFLDSPAELQLYTLTGLRTIQSKYILHTIGTRLNVAYGFISLLTNKTFTLHFCFFQANWPTVLPKRRRPHDPKTRTIQNVCL